MTRNPVSVDSRAATCSALASVTSGHSREMFRARYELTLPVLAEHGNIISLEILSWRLAGEFALVAGYYALIRSRRVELFPNVVRI